MDQEKDAKVSKANNDLRAYFDGIDNDHKKADRALKALGEEHRRESKRLRDIEALFRSGNVEAAAAALGIRLPT